MKVQVLVAAMNQKDHSLVEKMHIRSDAVIGNQCDGCSNETFNIDGHRIIYLNRPDRGVGLNRNEAMLHCSDDVILTFADEDMTFVDGYEDRISTAFQEFPQADAIIFNIYIQGESRGNRENTAVKRVHFYNAFNYGAARLSVRANSLKRENIAFHTCFGGGTRYAAGEDSLFIADMLKHKMKIYTHPTYIAHVDQSESTWFHGFDEKYLHDKGALYAAITRRWAKLLCLQDLVRHPQMYQQNNFSFLQAYKMMRKGISDFKMLRPYKDERARSI